MNTVKALAFTHLKIVKKPKAEDPLPTPFELPRNYPQDVMDELKQNRLSGRARAKFIASICSAIFKYKSLPTTSEYNQVGEQIFKQYPFLKTKSGSYVSALMIITYMVANDIILCRVI